MPEGHPTVALAGLTALFALGAAPSRAADSPEADPGQGPQTLSARLTMSPAAREACLQSDAVPPERDCSLSIPVKLERAYLTALQRLFRPPPPSATADIELTVESIRADIRAFIEGSRVALEVTLRISGAGGEIDRLKLYDTASILGTGSSAIEEATARVIEATASELRRVIARSDKTRGYLIARGVPPVEAHSPWPARSRWLAFADVGGGWVSGDGLDAAGTGVVRLGVGGPWFIAQIVASKWSSSFEATPLSSLSPIGTYSYVNIVSIAKLDVADVGVEGGPALRFGSWLEVRLGAGLHRLWGTAKVVWSPNQAPISGEWSVRRTVPSLFGAVQAAVWPTRGGSRFRAGLEVRRYISTTVELAELSRTIPIANLYLGLFVDFELALSSPRAGGAR